MPRKPYASFGTCSCYIAHTSVPVWIVHILSGAVKCAMECVFQKFYVISNSLLRQLGPQALFHLHGVLKIWLLHAP